MIAMLQTTIGTDHPYAQMDWSEISAFQRVGLDPDLAMMEVEDLSEDMEAAMAYLE